MKLLDALLRHTQRWHFVFPQARTLERALALAFGILCGVGKRTLTRAISFQGNTQKDWSADYKVFSRSPWEPRALFDPILQQAIPALIVSPNLEKPPVFESEHPASFRNPVLLEAYRNFRADDKTRIGPTHMTSESFVTPLGELFTAVSIYLPASAGFESGRKVTFFGAIENARGEIIEVHEDEVTLSPTRGDAYVDKSLRLAPGTYSAIFGLAENDGIVGMTKADLRIHALDPKESAVSPLILSNNTFALPRAQKLTDPFAFGGLKVVPKGDGVFVPSDDIWYFTELRNPGLTTRGLPSVEVVIEIEGRTTADTDVRWKLPQQTIETIPLKGDENHYGLAMSIPLERFHPGSYTVRIEVRDTVLGRSYQLQSHFRVNPAS